MSFKEFFDSRVVDSLRHVHVDLDGLYALLVSARRQSSDADMRQTGALWARDDLLASGEREFLLAWDGELTRVRAVIDAQAGELTTALSAIERRAAHTDGNTRDADALAKRVVALERFVSLNYDALRHLAALQSRGAPSALLTRLNESLALCDVFEQLLLTLSRVYTALRVSAGDASESDESDIADDQRAGADGVFVRATTKYLDALGRRRERQWRREWRARKTASLATTTTTTTPSPMTATFNSASVNVALARRTRRRTTTPTPTTTTTSVHWPRLARSRCACRSKSSQKFSLPTNARFCSGSTHCCCSPWAARRLSPTAARRSKSPARCWSSCRSCLCSTHSPSTTGDDAPLCVGCRRAPTTTATVRLRWSRWSL
eukprot:TRINITY_DN98_c0_g1_i5.p1 TRINITY_DN98_c0_g1~~TRINITY_DN98_c0_g1_i5.p1  ORF type:complete len:391 (+),score=146.78 TRINITY_DN98_c0_g1_i5:43-1173(+)